MDDSEAERRIGGEIAPIVERSTDAHVHRDVIQEQALLAGPAQEGAVRDSRAEVGVPGIEMRVEVDQGYGTPMTVEGPQRPERNGVIAADRDDSGARLDQSGGVLFDGVQRLGYRVGVGTDIAGVGHLLDAERL